MCTVYTVRDVIMGKLLAQPLRWWGRICPPGWNRVKISEDLGATAVAPVALVVTSLTVYGIQHENFMTCDLF